MLTRLSKKNVKKLTAAITMGLCLVAAPSAFALNSNGDGTGTGNKPMSFSGYELVDNNTILLYFDHETSPNGEISADMFTIKDGSTSLGITIPSTYDGVANPSVGSNRSGCSDSLLTKGTRVAIDLSSGTFSTNGLYKVIINTHVMDKNGITTGNYRNTKDTEFYFRAPSDFSTWAYSSSYAPYVSFMVGDPDDISGGAYQNVSWESNVGAIFDRPIKADTLSTFLGNLDNGFRNNTDNAKVVVHSEAYTPTSNNVNSKSTVFYFPMTKEGRTQTALNRDQGAHEYTLTLPAFTDISNNAWAAANFQGADGCSVTFNTVSSDYPGWEMNGSSASDYNHNLNITSNVLSWYATPITPTPTGYKVYYIQSNSSGIHQYSAKNSWSLLATVTSGTSLDLTTAGLTVGNYYWFRVVPYNATGEVGMSKTQASVYQR